ncbi:hypothetical protein JOF58_004412 [Streptomyces cinnamonensis]|nr:hypothetical protein [Streptomyces virginiae]
MKEAWTGRLGTGVVWDVDDGYLPHHLLTRGWVG